MDPQLGLRTHHVFKEGFVSVADTSVVVQPV